MYHGSFNVSGLLSRGGVETRAKLLTGCQPVAFSERPVALATPLTRGLELIKGTAAARCKRKKKEGATLKELARVKQEIKGVTTGGIG